ncbi:MAG: DUF3107 domain-containing protein [Candidatus Nanopelagicales bacterium]
MAKAAAKNPIEVKIGVQYSPRELTVEVNQTPAEIATAVDEAVASNTVLRLTDVRGRQIMIPTASLSYVEIGPPQVRHVGFGASD